jgi:integrase
MAERLYGSIQKQPSGRYRCVVYDPTTGKQVSATRDTRKEAEEFGKEQHDKLTGQAREMHKAGLTDADRKQFTDALATFKKKGVGALQVKFSQLLDRFTKEKVVTFSPGAQRAYEQSFAPFRAFFIDKLKDPLVHEVDEADVAAFMGWRRSHPVRGTTLAAATLRKDRGCLHGLFAFAIRPCRLLTTNPVADTENPKIEERDPVILSDAEFETLLLECTGDPMLAMFTLVCGETGARSESEVLWLRWGDLDFENGWLTIKSDRQGHQTKTKKTRRIPMSSRLKTALAAHVKTYEHATYDGVRSPWVFTYTETRGKQHVAGQRITSLRYPFKRAAKRAGVEAVRQHDLRHRAGSRWATKSIALAAAALGHSSTKMTERYTHLKPQALRALVD